MSSLAPSEVRALAKLIDDLDYYQLLELERGAPASAVKRAYYDASRKFHPDANRHLAGSDREALGRIAKRISEAYQVLRDARRRGAYDEQLGAGAHRIPLAAAEARAEKQAADDYLGKTPNGRRFFGLARAALEKGDLASAARNMKMALTFEPTNEGFKKKAEEIRLALRNAPPGHVGPPGIGR
jgi:DnaJ-class molecular chaperone